MIDIILLFVRHVELRTPRRAALRIPTIQHFTRPVPLTFTLAVALLDTDAFSLLRPTESTSALSDLFRVPLAAVAFVFAFAFRLRFSPSGARHTSGTNPYSLGHPISVTLPFLRPISFAVSGVSVPISPVRIPLLRSSVPLLRNILLHDLRRKSLPDWVGIMMVSQLLLLLLLLMIVLLLLLLLLLLHIPPLVLQISYWWRRKCAISMMEPVVALPVARHISSAFSFVPSLAVARLVVPALSFPLIVPLSMLSLPLLLPISLPRIPLAFPVPTTHLTLSIMVLPTSPRTRQSRPLSVTLTSRSSTHVHDPGSIECRVCKWTTTRTKTSRSRSSSSHLRNSQRLWRKDPGCTQAMRSPGSAVHELLLLARRFAFEGRRLQAAHCG